MEEGCGSEQARGGEGFCAANNYVPGVEQHDGPKTNQISNLKKLFLEIKCSLLLKLCCG